MATGWTEEEEQRKSQDGKGSTEGTDIREKREEGKRRDGMLSSQELNGSGRKKVEESKKP